MTADHAGRRLFGALFVASGAIALGCETLWFRALSLRFGSTLGATGMLLAVFMTGLALGGELGARLADRLVRPARGYAIAELVVAASAALSPSTFRFIAPFVLTAGPVVRLVAATAVLAPATVAMGATLPFLAAAFVPSREALRDGVGRLYSLNVAGASAGALFTSYVLLPHAGLVRSAYLLAASGTMVACIAWFAARTIATRTHDTQHAIETTSNGALAVVLAAGLGVLTFALQVTWNRVFALLLGSTAYTFGLVAAVILGASALGGAWGRREDAPIWPGLARLCLLFAIAVDLGTLLVYVAPQPLAVAAATRGASVRWVRLALVASVVAVPSFLAGAMFPALASRFPGDGIGRASGRAQFVVTAGNVTGSLAAAFIGVPHFGSQRVLEFVAACGLALALIASVPAGLDRVRGTALASVLAVAFAWVAHPAWDRAALSAGTFRRSAWLAPRERSDAPCGPSRRFGRHRLLFAAEGRLATVVVLGHPGGPDCSLYSLRINGKAEGSVFVRAPLGDRVPANAERIATGDLPTELLAGWLPGALARPSGSAFLVGWGTGISTRGLLFTRVASIRAVEIEPSVLDAADRFEPDARRDRRVAVRIDDARVALEREPPRSLDVIASHPSNPWVAGAAALFSREYFDLARTRLRPGGRILAWVQLYDSDLSVVRDQIATFQHAFGDTFVLRPAPDARDLLLLGIFPPGPSDRATLATALDAIDPTVLAALRPIGLDRAGALVNAVIADPAETRRIAARGVVRGEDDASVEYRVADHLLRADGESPEQIVEALRVTAGR